jgi:hypothetical protein
MNILSLAEAMGKDPYPGRGIVVGKTEDQHMVVVYFIMGRSENSRNRVFVKTEDGIRTQAHDPAKLVDPSLIIYSPVRYTKNTYIVTNGDQTDDIANALAEGRSFEDALRARTFEPDPPIYTPRISAVVPVDRDEYRMSILKSADGDPRGAQRFFYEYDHPLPGRGHFLHTYGPNVSSFDGDPEPVAICGGLKDVANEIWTNLDPQNKVALYAFSFDQTGKIMDYVIDNTLG